MKKNFMLFAVAMMCLLVLSPVVAQDSVDHPPGISTIQSQFQAGDAGVQTLGVDTVVFVEVQAKAIGTTESGARVGTAGSSIYLEQVISSYQKAGDLYCTGSPLADYSNQDANARQEVFTLRVQMRSTLPGENLLNDYRSAA